MSDLTTEESAVLLIAGIRAALLNGCRHYDSDGRLLTTEMDVLRALKAGAVQVDESEAVVRTTIMAELPAAAALLAQYRALEN